MPPIDERRRWEDSADAWGRWAEHMQEPADRINRPLLALGDIGPGQRVLDLATGAGEPALTMADRVGAAGLVIGTDIVPAMLHHTTRRAAVRGAQIPLAAADMQRLPFPDACFDRVLSRFGIMFAPDSALALAEMRRVLRPGGRLALAVWGPVTDNTLFAEIRTTIDSIIGDDPHESLAPLFRFAGEDSLAAMMRDAGLDDAREQSLRLDQDAPAARPFWRPTLEMGFTPRLAGLAPDRRARVETAIATRFREIAGGDGMVPLRLHVRLATAIRA